MESVQIDGLALAVTGLIVSVIAYALATLAAHLALAILGGINHYVHRIPFLGGIVGGAVSWLEKHINNLFTSVLNGLEANIGWYWSELGNLFASLGNEILGLSAAFDSLVSYLYGVVKPWVVHSLIGGILHGVKWVKHEIVAVKHQVFHVTKVIEGAATGTIGAAVHRIVKPIEGSLKGFEAWTLPRIKALEHGVEVVLPRDIAGLRSRAKALEREYSNLWKRVRGLDKLTVGALFAGAVAVALGRLGAGWVRCANWRNIGRAVCRTPYGDIEGLLGLLVAGAVIADFRELVKLAQSVEHGVAVGIKDITGA